jgi:DNA-directed RNA polymerase specialized sigma24 family protein
LQTALFPSATLAEFYRFALLLTGDLRTAEQIMARTLAMVESQLAELRSDASRQAWLAQRIRERCLSENACNENPVPRLLRTAPEGRPEILKIEAFIVAQRFSTLPEPERTALALFYVDIFQPADIAQLLKMSIDELASVLGHARLLLAAAMHEEPA